MTRPAIRLEVLPASYGDCLLLECPVGRGTWRLLVDTGPDETYPALRARLAAIKLNSRGKRRIDLFVVSHIDHDHIGGAALLLSDKALKLEFGDVWFNAPPQPRPRGVREGQVLAGLMGAPGVKLPWNQAYKGEHAVAPNGGFMEVPGKASAPRLTLLSPTPERLDRLFKVWERELARMARRPEAEEAPRSRSGFDPDLQPLAAKASALDRAPANGSSIALLLEHKGASVLLAADAHAPVLVAALKSLATHRGVSSPLQVDAIKLSHHGSQANVTKSFFASVQAAHHIVSTNGAIFGHPDDVAIARTILHGGREPTLWFNFATEKTRRWNSAALKRRHGYQTVYPGADAAGVRLDLMAAAG